jgi:hypothetical protein
MHMPLEGHLPLSPALERSIAPYRCFEGAHKGLRVPDNGFKNPYEIF